jgi:hypothetical protein
MNCYVEEVKNQRKTHGSKNPWFEETPGLKLIKVHALISSVMGLRSKCLALRTAYCTNCKNKIRNAQKMVHITYFSSVMMTTVSSTLAKYLPTTYLHILYKFNANRHWIELYLFSTANNGYLEIIFADDSVSRK